MRKFTAALILSACTAVATGQPNSAIGNPPPATFSAEPVFPAAPEETQTFPIPIYPSAGPANDPRLAFFSDVNPTNAALVVSDTVYRSRAFRAEIGAVPSVASIADGKFIGWTGGDTALRLMVGFERETGYGSRFRLWVFDQIQSFTNAPDVDLMAGSMDLDFYKRFYLESSELVVGAGMTSAHLEFATADNHISEFTGVGASVFAELWHPLARFQKTDVGFAARGRFAVVPGMWTDNTGWIVPKTDEDTMYVTETAWGLEVRRRFGLSQDKYWYFAFLLDYQSLTSAWMTRYLVSATTFSGVNFTSGIAW